MNDRDDQLQETPGAPSLISKSNRDRWIGAAIVSKRGPTEVLVRSDSEQAILVLKESSAAALRVNVKKVEGALYASRSNGVAESAVKDGKDAVKTNLARLDIGSCLGWCNTAAMVNRCRRGPDGKTAHELRKRRTFARALSHFAEEILCMIPGIKDN